MVFREQLIRWTWKEFAEEVDLLASGLLALGIEKGDRVGIWSPNRVEWLLTQFATARIGAVLVNINPAYRLAELEYALNKVGCKAIIAAETFQDVECTWRCAGTRAGTGVAEAGRTDVPLVCPNCAT